MISLVRQIFDGIKENILLYSVYDAKTMKKLSEVISVGLKNEDLTIDEKKEWTSLKEEIDRYLNLKTFY